MKGKKKKDKKRKGTRSSTELPPQGTTLALATVTSSFNPIPTATAKEQQVTQPSLPTTSPIDSAQNSDNGPSLFPFLQPQGKGNVAPKLWTVEEVARWLRSKGFNEDICDKFTKNEVDGEVLLGLNDENLKSGIGIEAYGPRLKIMNAMNDLFPGVTSAGRMGDAGDFFPDEEKGKQRHNDPVLDPELKDLQLFWEKMWVDRMDPFEEQDVLRDFDCVVDVEVPKTCKVLCHLPNVFRYGDVLVRKEYEEAQEAIKGYEMTQNAVIIVGNPGIGKTIFLYYLLVNRLLLSQPTLFQSEDESILLFNENGVTQLSPKSFLTQSSTSSTWALVDANPSLSKPAPMILRDGSPFFAVVASSPRSVRRDKVAHYRPPLKLWFMEPFSLGELIQARHLQRLRRSERELQQFFELYGPSARDCYAFCVDIPSYRMFIEDKIKSMTWPTITDALEGTNTLQLDKGSHKIILIAPDPENRETYRPRIITKAIASMLCERNTNERRRNAYDLYRSCAWIQRPNLAQDGSWSHLFMRYV